jgi:hypothetical protein
MTFKRLSLGWTGTIIMPMVILTSTYGMLMMYQQIVAWSLGYQLLGFGFMIMGFIGILIYTVLLWLIDKGSVYIRLEVLPNAIKNLL